MSILIYIIIASFLVSLISLSGAVLFILNEKKIQKYLFFFVSFAAGSLLGTAFFNLIPQSFSLAYENGKNIELSSYFILIGILFFYIIEKFVHWHHHHDINCNHHTLSTLSLVGDGFHNFIDGILISATFLVDVKLGIITTIVIIFHEIPQEIGDLAILLHSKFSKSKALLWNFLSGITSLIGAISSYFIFENIRNLLPLILALTAGGFIYIALADIIPELHKKKVNILALNLLFFLGIILSFLFSFLE